MPGHSLAASSWTNVSESHVYSSGAWCDSTDSWSVVSAASHAASRAPQQHAHSTTPSEVGFDPAWHGGSAPDPDEIDEICTVCCEAIEKAGAPPLGLARCSHVFHTDCLVGWLRHQSRLDAPQSCPNCRTEARLDALVSHAPLSAASIALLQQRLDVGGGVGHVDRGGSIAHSDTASCITYATARGWPRLVHPARSAAASNGRDAASLRSYAQVASSARPAAAPGAERCPGVAAAPPSLERERAALLLPKPRRDAAAGARRAGAPVVVIIGGRLTIGVCAGAREAAGRAGPRGGSRGGQGARRRGFVAGGKALGAILDDGESDVDD